MDRLTLPPFLLALFVGVALMPTNVYQICRRNAGTLEIEPWADRSSSLARVARTVVTWFVGLWSPRTARLCAGLALVVLLAHVFPDQVGAGAGLALTIPELLQKKGELAEQARAILAAAPAEGMKAEDEVRFEAIHADIEKIAKQIEQLAKQDAVDQSLNDTGGRRSLPNQSTGTGGTQSRVTAPSQADAAEGLRAWLLPEESRTPAMLACAQRAGIAVGSKNFAFKLPAVPLKYGEGSNRREDIAIWHTRNQEHRAAMGTTSGAVGQYTVPDAAMQALEVALLAFGGTRRVATVIRTDSGAALPFPTTDDTANEGAILGENTQVSEVDVTFGQLVLDAYMYSSKSVLVSLQLMQDSAVNVPELIGRLLGERLGRIQNRHFTVGTGSSQPNGIVTASTLGATATALTATTTYDFIVDLVHSIDPAYRENGKFMFHDGGLKMLKKIKVLQYSGDTTGVPLWSPGLSPGAPDTILGYSYVVNQHMVTPATAVRSIIFGDLSKYQIRDVRDITLVRLDERYADYHQVGFLAFARSDGDLLDAGTRPVKHHVQG